MSASPNNQHLIMREDSIGRNVVKNSRTGFSLIEFVGVLAVLAILSAVLIPVVIKRLDRAAWTKEMSDLGAISNALTLQILRSNTIPDQNGWAAAAANWVSHPLGDITSNRRKFARFYLIDPTLTGLTLPYPQTGNLGLPRRPANARIILVSAIARTNPPVSNGNSLPLPSFDDIWNTPQYSKPSSWAAWPGTGEDACIQRLNLEPMFYQLIVVNRDQGSAATFSINGANVTVVTNIHNGWYLEGSVVNLCSNGVTLVRYVLNRNTSFVFENNFWNGGPGGGPPSNDLANGFTGAATKFFNSQWNAATASKGAKGSTQSAVLSVLANVMLDYTMWADTTPPFNANGVSPIGQVPMYQIFNGGPDTGQGNVSVLNAFTGSGNMGLLYNR